MARPDHMGVTFRGRAHMRKFEELAERDVPHVLCELPCDEYPWVERECPLPASPNRVGNHTYFAPICHLP